MPYITEATKKWIEENSSANPDESRSCKRCGTDLMAQGVRRSIHDGPFPLSGAGKTKEVLEVWCPTCNPDKVFPESGAPIGGATKFHPVSV